MQKLFSFPLMKRNPLLPRSLTHKMFFARRDTRKKTQRNAENLVIFDLFRRFSLLGKLEKLHFSPVTPVTPRDPP